MSDKKLSPLSFILMAAALIVGLGGGYALSFLIGPADSSGNITFELENEESVGDDWVLTVDDFAFRMSDFNNIFDLTADSLSNTYVMYGEEPTTLALKGAVIQELAMYYMLTVDAIEEGIFDDAAYESYLKYIIMQGVGQIYASLYMEDMYPEDATYFDPTEDEINEVFAEYRTEFMNSGMTSAEIEEYITYTLQQEAYETWQSAASDTMLQQLQMKYSIEMNEDELLADAVTPTFEFPSVDALGDAGTLELE